jgi:hypothetical protein
MKKLALILLVAPLALSGGCASRGAYAHYDPSFDDGRHGYEPPITYYPRSPYRAFPQPSAPQTVYPQPSFPQPGNPMPVYPQAMYIYPQSVYIYPPPASPQPVNRPTAPAQPVYPQPGNPEVDLPRTDPQAIYPRPAYQ